MRQFGLLGKTLKHSFSQKYFTEKFRREGITDCRYDNFEIAAIEALPALLQSLQQLNGFNITIPYKEEVLPFLHSRNKIVTAVGACNCVKLNDGRLAGFNTDVAGFQQSIRPHLKPHHKHALVLGTGGAAKAVQYALSDMGIDYQLVSRHSDYNRIGYECVGKELLDDHTLIINTTPLGMYPEIDASPPLPYEYLGPQHLLYDLVYNPAKTIFLQKGEEQGAGIVNGADMLVIQAEESWKIWNE